MNRTSFSWKYDIAGEESNQRFDSYGIAPQLKRVFILFLITLDVSTAIHKQSQLSLLRPSGSLNFNQFRNINLISIDDAFRPNLRT